MLLAQCIGIPDVNFKNASIVRGYEVGTLDARVLMANIDTLTTLDFDSSHIKKLHLEILEQ